MKYKPLSREQVKSVIEGRGAASRIPAFVHFWTHPEVLEGEAREKAANLLAEYPQDFEVYPLRIPGVYNAPADDPSYRWSFKDEAAGGTPDNSGFIEDWGTDLEPLLADFPDAEYPGLLPDHAPADGRYRIGHWWYCYFERLWSVRGMQNALMDFYDDPEAIHAFFDRLCDFYIRMVERAKEKYDLDAIFTSDDLGTQTGTFFSPKIFDAFFAPYYKRLIDRVHELGMHFWLHACGNIEPFLSRFIELGVDVIHPIQKYTMDERMIAERYGDRIAIWAGFDVQQIFPFGTPEEVRREVRYLIDAYIRTDGRFMFTMGNGTTEDMPPENLEALLEELFGYGTQRLAELNAGCETLSE